jgi:hypothetical protein
MLHDLLVFLICYLLFVACVLLFIRGGTASEREELDDIERAHREIRWPVGRG